VRWQGLKTIASVSSVCVPVSQRKAAIDDEDAMTKEHCAIRAGQKSCFIHWLLAAAVVIFMTGEI